MSVSQLPLPGNNPAVKAKIEAYERCIEICLAIYCRGGARNALDKAARTMVREVAELKKGLK